ncbi:MAG TPA: efflux RND transporter permease subunit [Gemmatimonadaceae bacterium]
MNHGQRSSLFGVLATHRRVVYLLVTLLSVVGIWAAFRLPSAIYPELRFSRITVVAQGSSLGARQVLFAVTRPLEEAVAIVPGVTRVQSRTIRGGSEVNVTFAPTSDMQFALQQVQARVNQVRADLPPGLTLDVERLTPSLFPILSYNLEGGDPATLYDIGEYQLRPLLSRVPGVGRVDVQASDVRELEVVADPGRLAAQGMTYDDLASAIREATTVQAVGRVPADYREYLLVTTTEARSPEDVADIVVGHGLRVRDLATVVLGTEDHVRIVAGDGRPAALINVTRQQGGNTVAIADSIAALVAAVQATLPPGVRLKRVYDQAALVRDAMTSVRDAMLIGAALAVIVLLLFLRHGRITAISATSIPLTMAITVACMAAIGQTFNLMTLGAMAIAIGLVIDDAVVVTENIVRHLPLATSRTHAIREAVQELVWPITTSTITTVVVFLPLGLLTGVEGQFFHALSIVLTIAVLVSLLLSLTVIPLLAQQYLRDVDVAGDDERAPGSGILARVGHALDALSLRYERTLAAVLHHGRATLGVVLVLVAAGVVVHRFVGSGFLPEMDEGAFVLDYTSPGGTALPETDRQVRLVEQILARTPEVSGTSRRTGAELGLFATQQNVGDVVVRLRPARERRRTSFEVIDDVRARIRRAVPRLRIEFVQILSDVINDLAGAARPVEIKLYGSDLATLEAYGRRLGIAVARVSGLEDVFNGVSEPSADMELRIDQAEGNRVALSPGDVGRVVSGALLGSDAGTVRLDDRSVAIRVRAPDSVRFNPLRLGALPVVSRATGAAVPLAALATFRATESRAELRRENQQQMIDLTADLSGRSLGAVMADVKRVLAATPPPPGVRVELAGQYASQQQAFRALLAVLALAALSVVAVMLVQFQSFIEPLVVLLAAPLSFTGALTLLLLTGTPLNVSSFMGMILLVGLVVKNGIILLDFTRRRMREAGVALEPALIEAARVRLRPILMTTLCTLFGLLPLALGVGAGSALQKPLALAVIGGLALSTPITLFMVPTLLVAIRGRDYRITPPPADAP